MDPLPPLPPITDQDLVLAVYSHESLLTEHDNFGDPKSLASLGSYVLEQALSFHYLMKQPALSAQEIENQTHANYPNFLHLLHSYGLRKKILCYPEYSATIDTEEGATTIFHKYIGASFLQNGIGTVQEWVSRLVDPGSPVPNIPTGSHRLHQLGGFQRFQRQPPPPPAQPPPPPPPPSYSYSQGSIHIPPPPQSMPSNNSFQILAQFNMTAHQRGFAVTYPARSEGPHHTPTWHVQCCPVFLSFSGPVNGEPRGEGVGKNQKQAKELAARQAWIAMGWGHCKDDDKRI
ncbi:hypothetical protein P691DRAFT_789637 [Macrolepiota fuliginosa MF-IS2]|uniref:DRBM domain-containing protein n=1 Tax=Macrolepiota fuliginosa MF-IS2 TaxID=1400762 RepID=A0A9P5XP50_9AGAR|nr:hypothetical protein P691DRAFT_789637 [Macrolepiota fuliginosa MF-IS2]